VRAPFRFGCCLVLQQFWALAQMLPDWAECAQFISSWKFLLDLSFLAFCIVTLARKLTNVELVGQTEAQRKVETVPFSQGLLITPVFVRSSTQPTSSFVV
jgi:hypothetical protein